MAASLQARTLASPLLAAARQARRGLCCQRPVVLCQADRQQQGEAPTAASPPPAAPPAAPSVRRPPPTPAADNAADSLQVKRVEQRGDSRFSGVVALDRGQAPTDVGRIALLAGGDAAALLLFASIGRLSHGEGLSLAGALGTAWPFLAGWYGAAALLDGYGKAAGGGNVGAAAGAAAKAWAVGIPAGLLLRSLTRGYLPDTSFIVVSMAVNGLLLVGWRAALAAATEEAAEPATPQEQLRARKDRKGGVFEMFSMLTSLTKRW